MVRSAGLVLFTFWLHVALLGGGRVRAQCELGVDGWFSGSQIGDSFGRAVAASGNFVIVGAPLYDCDIDSRDCGTAYMYSLHPNGWTSQRLSANLHRQNEFGSSVAVAGSVAVVGAPGDNYCQPSGGRCGKAYVYRNGILESTMASVVGTALVNAEFGSSVSASNDVVVVGEPGQNSFRGRVHVFRYNGATRTWVREANLQASDATNSLSFGRGVAISGDVLAVGSTGGRAYVFRFTSGSWVEEKKLVASDGEQLTHAVAVSGNLVVVGVPGAGYVFRFNGSDWVQETKLISPENSGFALAASGNLIILGDSSSPQVFTFNGLNWEPRARLMASGGAAVAISGDRVVVGAPGPRTAYRFELENADCNSNGIVDECDIADGTSGDCNLDGVPDECEIESCDGNHACIDCNVNGIPDSCDIETCQADHPACHDCNRNLSPDVCDIAASLSVDKNANGIPDECEKCLFDVDCDDGLYCNGQEVCESSSCSPGRFPCRGGESCDENATVCFPDCNRNKVRDDQDIAIGTSDDCDSNYVPDECEPDEDSDGVIDACDLCFGTFSALIVDVDGCPVSVGACCFNGDVCIGSINLSDCKLVGGHYLGDGVTCAIDHDRDGEIGCSDLCPLDPHKSIPGLCGCGVAETDSDFDLTPDCLDACPDDYDKVDPGVCGCGIPDIDTDDDAVLDCLDPCPFDDPDDTDGDGVCDHADRCPLDFLDDSDDDGVCDSNDGCPDDAEKSSPGACGCGVTDDDADVDGIANCNDQCANTPSTIRANMCGCSPQGACCFSVGVCFDGIAFGQCASIGGFYQGDGARCSDGCGIGDFDSNGSSDIADFVLFMACFAGPATPAMVECASMDFDTCRSVDLRDYAVFLDTFGRQ